MALAKWIAASGDENGLDIPMIVIYVSIIEFYKGVTQLGGQIDH